MSNKHRSAEEILADILARDKKAIAEMRALSIDYAPSAELTSLHAEIEACLQRSSSSGSTRDQPPRVADPISAPQPVEMTWHDVVTECEKLFGCRDTAQSPIMSNLPNLVRDTRAGILEGFPLASRNPLHIGNMTDDEQRRCLEIGKKIRLDLLYRHQAALGCSPRDAIDSGRLAEVEAWVASLEGGDGPA